MTRVGNRIPRARPPSVHLQPHQCSPNPVDLQSVQAWLERTPKPWAVDLFSGAGGLSFGLARAGFSIVAAADNDGVALSTSWCKLSLAHLVGRSIFAGWLPIGAAKLGN